MKFNQKGGATLADIELLKEKIADSGMTVKAISEKSGILRETFYNRLKGGRRIHSFGNSCAYKNIKAFKIRKR